MLYIYKITLFFLLVKGSDDDLPVDLHDAFDLDREHLVVLVLAELAGEADLIGLVLGDFLAVLVVAGLGDEPAVDLRAAVVVIPLVADDMGEHQPLAPRQTGVLGGDGASLTLLLHAGNVVVVDTQTGLESGLLEDFGLALADLHGADRLERDDLALDSEQALHARGEVADDGVVVHGCYVSGFGVRVKHLFQHATRLLIWMPSCFMRIIITIGAECQP
jgi:hypothetical protein